MNLTENLGLSMPVAANNRYHIHARRRLPVLQIEKAFENGEEHG